MKPENEEQFYEIKNEKAIAHYMFLFFLDALVQQDLKKMGAMMAPAGNYFNGMNKEKALRFFEEQYAILDEYKELDIHANICCSLDVNPANPGIEIMNGLWPFLNPGDERLKILIPLIEGRQIVGLQFGYHYLSIEETEISVKCN